MKKSYDTQADWGKGKSKRRKFNKNARMTAEEWRDTRKDGWGDGMETLLERPCE